MAIIDTPGDNLVVVGQYNIVHSATGNSSNMERSVFCRVEKGIELWSLCLCHFGAQAKASHFTIAKDKDGQRLLGVWYCIQWRRRVWYNWYL